LGQNIHQKDTSSTLIYTIDQHGRYGFSFRPRKLNWILIMGYCLKNGSEIEQKKNQTLNK
jgi:hypothetical protein